MQSLKQKRQKPTLLNYIILSDGVATVSNGEYWHTVRHDINMECTTPLLVDAKPFLQIVKNRFNVSVGPNGEVLSDGSLIGKVQTFTCIDDFPDCPATDEITTSIKVDVKEALLFSSKKDTRFYLCGVCVDFVGSVCNVVSTDGGRLYRREYITGAGVVEQHIIPNSACLRIAKLKNYTLHFHENGVIKATGDEGTVTTKGIGGKFPDFKRVIPCDLTGSMIVDRVDLINKIKLIRPSLCPNGTIRIDQGAVWHNNVKFDIRADGDAFNSAFNHRYILDVLKTIKSEFVTMEAHGDASILKIIDGDACYIVMPIKK